MASIRWSVDAHAQNSRQGALFDKPNDLTDDSESSLWDAPEVTQPCSVLRELQLAARVRREIGALEIERQRTVERLLRCESVVGVRVSQTLLGAYAEVLRRKLASIEARLALLRREARCRCSEIAALPVRRPTRRSFAG